MGIGRTRPVGIVMAKRQSTVESKKRYDYEEELEKLHLELMKLQDRKSTRLNSSH